MAVYQITKKGEPVLREKAKRVPEITKNILKLLDNLKDTLFDANGAGLAAPQIGISKRAVVVNVDDEYIELINPEIIAASGEQTDYEGCLSIPGLIGEVTRAEKVTVKGWNRQGEEIEVTRRGMMARALQHEIDHLDGILYIDKAENIRSVE